MQAWAALQKQSWESILCRKDKAAIDKVINDRSLVRMLAREFGESYATQVVTPNERRIIANVMSGTIRAKATMEHIALCATDMALQADTLPDPAESADDKQTKKRYHALRKYDLVVFHSAFLDPCMSVGMVHILYASLQILYRKLKFLEEHLRSFGVTLRISEGKLCITANY